MPAVVLLDRVPVSDGSRQPCCARMEGVGDYVPVCAGQGWTRPDCTASQPRQANMSAPQTDKAVQSNINCWTCHNGGLELF